MSNDLGENFYNEMKMKKGKKEKKNEIKKEIMNEELKRTSLRDKFIATCRRADTTRESTMYNDNSKKIY